MHPFATKAAGIDSLFAHYFNHAQTPLPTPTLARKYTFILTTQAIMQATPFGLKRSSDGREQPAKYHQYPTLRRINRPDGIHCE